MTSSRTEPRVWLNASVAALCVGLFIGVLFLLWRGHIHFYSAIGGLLPYDDAGGYYDDARRVLSGGRFTMFAARRPLAPGLLATLLATTGGNLKTTVAILAIIDGLCCFAFVREIGRSFSLVAAASAGLLLFAFQFRYIGTTVTEHLGFCLGALGFALLFESARARDYSAALWGIASLSVALNARAGAFLALPAIVCWGAFLFSGEKGVSLRFVGATIGAVVFGFFCNAVVLRALGPEQVLPFSNFSHTIYGQVVGGKGWKQVFVDHPELIGLRDPALSIRIYQLAWEQLRLHPQALVVAIFKTWMTYALPGEYGSFSFVLTGSYVLDPIARSGLLILTGVGLVRAWHIRRRSNEALLCIYAFIGIVLSAPFVPPLDSIRMRPFAATIPAVVVIVAIGLDTLYRRIRPGEPTVRRWPDGPPRDMMAASLLLISFVVLGPILLRVVVPRHRVPVAHCQAGEDLAMFQLHRGSYLEVIDAEMQRSSVPSIRVNDLRRSYPVLFDSAHKTFFDGVHPGVLITREPELRTMRPMFVSMPAALVDLNQPIAVCGQSRGIFFSADRIAITARESAP